MYRRIVIKLSGEALAPSGHGASKGASVTFDPERVDKVAETFAKLSDRGIQLGVVLGGGNIWRGRFSDDMDAVNADQMGMLATIINALVVKDALLRMGKRAEVFTAQEMNRFAELYRADRAIEAMESGRIALLSGGTGNPFFTTDTAAVLRAAELHADAVFKGTKVEGVFDADPEKVPGAKLIKDISYIQARDRGLKVMDMTAFQLAIERKIPLIRVFSMEDLDNVIKVAEGDGMGTTVHM